MKKTSGIFLLAFIGLLLLTFQMLSSFTNKWSTLMPATQVGNKTIISQQTQTPTSTVNKRLPMPETDIATISPTIIPTIGPTTNALNWSAKGPMASVVDEAETLQYHIFGLHNNQYDAADPVFQPALALWMTECNTPGKLCPEAQSGNLQCVLFVTAAFALAGDPLPRYNDAQVFWPSYQGLPGWQEIPVGTGLPQAGDMIIWKGGAYVDKGTTVSPGHIAIVVKVVPPTSSQDGSVMFANANNPGNRYPGNNRSGNFYTLPIHHNWQVDGWPAYVDHGISYGSLQTLGYLRQTTPPTMTITGVPDQIFQDNKPLTISAATQAGINTVYFTRQMLLPSVSPLKSLSEWEIASNITSAAKQMATNHELAAGDDIKALAIYHLGQTRVDQVVTTCGDGWFRCLPGETQQYITTIVGSTS